MIDVLSDRDKLEHTIGTMGSSADNWLGPKLEQELKNVIGWKKRDNASAPLSTSATDEQSVYSYDGSNLWITVVYAVEEPVLVQVQQVSRSALSPITSFRFNKFNLRAMAPQSSSQFIFA